MQSAKDHQEAKMANMRKEISTLTRALTILTHKMVDKSSRHGGGGGYKRDGGYNTKESEEENTRPQTRARNDKKRPRSQEKPTTITADNMHKGDWKYNSKLKWNSDWKQDRKRWFKEAR